MIIVMVCAFLFINSYTHVEMFEKIYNFSTNLQGFREDASALETRIQNCQHAVNTFKAGKKTLENEFSTRKTADLANCRKNFQTAINDYKASFKIATGVEITDQQLTKIKNENGILTF